MKNKKMRKRLPAIAAAVMTLVLCMAAALPAFAAGTGGNVSPTDNLTTTFKKYLVMDQNANVPNVTFTFTITPGTAVEAIDDNPAVYAGIGSPIVGSASFTTATQTQQGAPEDAAQSDKKYASAEVSVNFSEVVFNKPGIYRYKLTEGLSPNPAITNNDQERTLDVYVEYENNGTEDSPDYSSANLVVSKYLIYSTVDDSNLNENKVDGFTNTYTTQDLTLKKQVEGNQGDRDKYFKFTVEITDAVAGTVYDVDLKNAEEKPAVDGVQQTNQSTLTVDGNGGISGAYYLKHDQEIVIQGLTAGTNYKITEDNYSKDGYTTGNTVDSVPSIDGNTTGVKSVGNTDSTVLFTNSKEGAIPTGILLETSPYIILVLAVLAGLAVLFATRRRRSGR